MTVLAADRNTVRREGDIYEFPALAAAKVYGGSIAAIDANGKAQPAADTAGLKVVGICEGYVDNSAGADDALSVKVRRGVFKLAASGLTDADIGKPLFIVDDQSVQLAATTNDVFAGILVQVESATEAWVALPMRVGAAVASVSQADAADQTGSYVEADVDSIADLANANKATLNELLVALRAAKIIAT